MAEVTFSHPLLSTPLGVSVRPDQITWAYGLNTKSYPTYGGEVVQILSVFFDDMTIAGTVGTVAEVEQIYSWFILYMQYATQGRSAGSASSPTYTQQPVKFSYPERGWHFEIWPKSLPGFRLGREVVAPTWQLTAAVKEPDATFADQLKDFATFNAQAGKLEQFGKTTADFGATGDLTRNPFASPDADPSRKNETVSQYLSKYATQYADSFSGFVQSWQSGSWGNLPQFNVSGPPKTPTQSSKKKKKGKTP